MVPVKGLQVLGHTSAWREFEAEEDRSSKAVLQVDSKVPL
jgi:hypothetical protein